jgi:hypothetical protein
MKNKTVLLLFILLGKIEGILIDPKWPRLGDEIVIKGEGYKDIVEIFFETGSISSKVKDGRFEARFILSSQPGGKKVITVKDEEKEETLIFWLKPAIKVSPLRGTKGVVVTVEGEGYSPYEEVQIGLGRNWKVKVAEATEAGTFSITFTVGNQPGGKNLLYAVGRKWYLDDRKHFFMEPSVQIEPLRGKVGASIIISGTGFSASDGPGPGETILIDFGTHQTIAKTYTDYFGSFETKLTVPRGAGGECEIKVRGEKSKLTVFEHFNITPKMEFPQTAFSKKLIDLKGEGFFCNERIEIVWNLPETTTCSVFSADEEGVVEIDYLVQAQPRGLRRVTVTTSESGFCKVFECKIEPYLEAVYKNGTLTVKGTGFDPNENLSLTFGGARHIGEAKADENGSFLKSFALSKLYGEKVIAPGRKGRAPVIGRIYLGYKER